MHHHSWSARILGGIVVVALALLAFGVGVMRLWNRLMPTLFKLPDIDYWQAVGLAVLARILSGHGRHHFAKHHGRGFAAHAVRTFHRDQIGDWRRYDEWWEREKRESFIRFTAKNSPDGQGDGASAGTP